MNAKRLTIVCLVVGGLFRLDVQVVAEIGAAQVASQTGEIRQLIAQLGDEQYLQRQLAEARLLQLGVDAFPALQMAQHHSDLEIATRAKYILNQIRIEWARASDPAAVRAIMDNFGDLSSVMRLAKVSQLASLKDEQGFGALCRVARFDTSPLIARSAALAILRQIDLPPKRVAAAVATLTAELGEGSQVPLSWIRVYMDQLQQDEQIVESWLPLIDAEIDLLARDSHETKAVLTLDLLRRYLELGDQRNDVQAIYASLQRRIDVLAQRDREANQDVDKPLTWMLGYTQWQTLKELEDSRLLGLVDTMTWLIYHEQWEAMKLVEEHDAALIENQSWLLYLVALRHDRQGRPEMAQKLVDRAFEADSSDAALRNQIADSVGELGRYDWAENEWRHVVETLPATDSESLVARSSLGLYRLHDRGEHQESVDLLNESIEAINNDPMIRQQYQTVEYRQYLRLATVNREYFLASLHEQKKDYVQQRRHLDRAYQMSTGNADVLIAMHRLQGANEQYRKATAKRIAKTLRNMELQIKQNPNDAQGYNQWAWLICNTTGDFDKAVERSLLSLELQPGNPSFLDTLGRCYYAVGDLENAIKTQREAIAKQPHLLVMRRQMKMFEEALAKRENAKQ